MKAILFNLCIFLILFSCATQTVPVEEPASVIKEKPLIEAEKTTVEKIEDISIDTLNENEIKEAETDIAALISKLNGIIASKDFESWKTYLSDDYIAYYSDPKILTEKSQSPLLIKYKIVLRSLEDYFNYVVVGSRQNVKLDEIKALDRDRIKAYMFINNNAVIIYELIRIDDKWKIGKFLE